LLVIDQNLQLIESVNGSTFSLHVDQHTAYGYGVSSAFVYTHAEDEASFSVVDNRSTAQKKASSYRTAGGTKVCKV